MKLSTTASASRRWSVRLAVAAVGASVSLARNVQLPISRAINSVSADVSACKLPAIQNVDLSSGFGYELDCAPSVGTLNAHMMFVDFPDQGATEASPEELRDFFLPEAAEWYAKSSRGALDLAVTADTSHFCRMPADATSYNWDRGLTYEQHKIYIQDALDACDAVNTVPTNVDVLYVVATANATAISFSPTFVDEVVTRDGVHITRKAVTFGLDAYITWGYLVLNHETGHTMCLADYYPINGSATGLFIGGWDLMGLISGPGPDYFAWDKWRLGWLADNEVACVAESGRSTHTLLPLPQGSADGKMDQEKTKKAEDVVAAVVIKHSDTEALIAEVRTAAGLDAKVCAPGVLLYTVSTSTPSGEGPMRVLDARPGSGSCAGDELNDATLSLDGTSSYAVPGWGVEITVLSKNGEEYEIQVDVS